MDYSELEYIALRLEQIWANLMGLNMAMIEGSSMLEDSVLQVPVIAMKEQLQKLDKVFNDGYNADKKASAGG